MLDCESLAQRMSALEEHIEQLNDHMKDLEEKLEDNYISILMSRQQSTSTDEGNWFRLLNTFISRNCGELLCSIHFSAWQICV